MALRTTKVITISLLIAVIDARRNYTASFTLSDDITGNVWIQWNSHSSNYATPTGWYFVGPLIAGSHIISFESDDIGENAYRFYLGMYGTGYEIITTLSSITTMDGITSYYQYSSTYEWICNVNKNNCCVFALNTYYDGTIDYGQTSNGCNDLALFESDRRMYPTIEPTFSMLFSK